MGTDQSYPFYVYSGLICGKHRQKMGLAIWEYAWCIDKVTREEAGVGLVLGGKPVTYGQIASDLGESRHTALRNMERLAVEGYLEVKRVQYGLIISVLKSKKFRGSKSGTSGKADMPDVETLRAKSGTSEKPKVAHLRSTCGTSLSIHDSTVDSTVHDSTVDQACASDPAGWLRLFSIYDSAYPGRCSTREENDLRAMLNLAGVEWASEALEKSIGSSTVHATGKAHYALGIVKRWCKDGYDGKNGKKGAPKKYEQSYVRDDTAEID